ncbi:aldo/keto reductase [Streptomyces sp. 8L]|uniref:aldo/keto reductase n=1 Tax=Streptomyces sp. 8L TaxID=2877242 RepID=UPI001CD47006|nr:aldo/keto reductase [Streptomyces sp. 8L]MCA1219650.1 aldo/keto reductase [Streptomyces sp. 8L]
MTDRRTLGRSDLSVSPLCLGANVFSWSADEKATFDILDAYRAGGGNFLDTADTYGRLPDGSKGDGSENLIGQWLAARGNRDEMVVATKVGLHRDYLGLAPGNIKRAAEQSLRRLGTDHIDLYYTHRDDESVPIEDIVSALDELVKEGKVRHIAASNISPERLAASLAFSEREGLARYVALQPHYNLVSRDTYEGALQDLAAANGLSALPYFSLAAGFLTGKYRPGTNVESVRAEKAGGYAETERGRKVLAALDVVAGEHDAEVATVALAWLAQRPTVAAPIASARTLEQLPALLALADLRLTDADIARLTTASA